MSDTTFHKFNHQFEQNLMEVKHKLMNLENGGQYVDAP